MYLNVFKCIDDNNMNLFDSESEFILYLECYLINTSNTYKLIINYYHYEYDWNCVRLNDLLLYWIKAKLNL